MGLDGLLDIGKSALSVAQQALTVTGHNVANVNTRGYSRQTAVVTARAPINGSSGPGQVGTGVHIAPGAIVRDGVSVGEFAVVGMGAVVTRDVPPFAVVTGVPARASGSVTPRD